MSTLSFPEAMEEDRHGKLPVPLLGRLPCRPDREARRLVVRERGRRPETLVDPGRIPPVGLYVDVSVHGIPTHVAVSTKVLGPEHLVRREHVQDAEVLR